MVWPACSVGLPAIWRRVPLAAGAWARKCARSAGRRLRKTRSPDSAGPRGCGRRHCAASPIPAIRNSFPTRNPAWNPRDRNGTARLFFGATCGMWRSSRPARQSASASVATSVTQRPASALGRNNLSSIAARHAPQASIPARPFFTPSTQPIIPRLDGVPQPAVAASVKLLHSSPSPYNSASSTPANCGTAWPSSNALPPYVSSSRSRVRCQASLCECHARRSVISRAMWLSAGMTWPANSRIASISAETNAAEDHCRDRLRGIQRLARVRHAGGFAGEFRRALGLLGACESPPFRAGFRTALFGDRAAVQFARTAQRRGHTFFQMDVSRVRGGVSHPAPPKHSAIFDGVMQPRLRDLGAADVLRIAKIFERAHGGQRAGEAVIGKKRGEIAARRQVVANLAQLARGQRFARCPNGAGPIRSQSLFPAGPHTRALHSRR